MGLCTSCDIDTYPSHTSHCNDPCNYRYVRVECCDNSGCIKYNQNNRYPASLTYQNPPPYNPYA